MTVVVAAVIERDGQVLIAQRKRGGRHALKWEFPGGKVESNETPPNALARELAEELGIQAQIGEEIARYEFQYPGRWPILLMFYRVSDYSSEAKNLEFEEILWVKRERLREYDFLEGDAEFLSRYVA